MGCFSSVCAISKLPIYGDPVVGIPLKRSDEGGVSCYPNWQWGMNGFPIHGRNDTYGRIEDYKKSPYLKLNKARFNVKSMVKLLDEWPDIANDSDLSIMYIHLPVWQEIQARYGKEAQERWDDAWKRTKPDNEIFLKSLKEILKKEGKKVPASLIPRHRCPIFHGEEFIPYEFNDWCDKNYTAEVKTAIIELMALNIACRATHTFLVPHYTIGEQISDWVEEVRWTKFFSDFAQAKRKECEEY